MVKKEERFVKSYEQSNLGGLVSIWIDTQTGVNYIFRAQGYAGGLTVLLDKEGKPVISNVDKL